METVPEKKLLFENHLDLNESSMIEYSRFKHWHSVWPFIAIAFFICVIGMFLYYLIAWEYFDYLSLIIAAVFLALYFIIDVTNLRREKKMVEEQSGGKPLILVKRFYEDGIEYGDSTSEAFRSGDYASLRKLRESKNMIIISTAAKRDYVLRKDGFTVGNAEDFESFINRRIMDNK